MSAALTAAWRAQGCWSQVANAAGASIDRWRWRNLALLGVGALMGALAAQDHWIAATIRSVLAIIGAAVLALAGVLQRAFLGPDQVKRHTATRAASEALKAEIYRYLTGVPPYDGDAADTVLARAVDRVDDDAAEFLAVKSSVTVEDRPMPAVAGIEDYVRDRAVAQRDWHKERIKSLVSRARRLRSAELAATAAAAVLAAVTSLVGFAELAEVARLGAWVGLATTASSAVAAHLAAGRYDRLAMSYAHAATQLDRLIVSRELPAPTVTDASFVDAVESVLAAQNGSWIMLVNA